MLRPQRPTLLLVPLAILGAAALASSNIMGRAQDAAEAEAIRLAAHAASLGQLELEARTRELEARAAAAGSLNAVRALAAQRVDVRTLRDGFETEEWWRGFRAEFPVQLFLLGPERYEFGKKELGRALKTDALVAEATKHSPASAVARAEDTVLLAGAALVDVPLDPSRRPALVVLAQPLTSEDLARVATRARGAVAITGVDHRVLGLSGPPDEAPILRELLARPRPILDGARGAAGSVPLGEGLSLWAYADARLASEAARRPAQTVVAVLWLLGLAACAALIVASFRRREPNGSREDVEHAIEHRREEPAADGAGQLRRAREEHALLEATQDELRRAREEHALLEATQDELRKAREEHALLEATQAELRRTRAELDRLRTPVPAPAKVDPVPAAAAPHTPPIPIQFGRYQLLQVLGQGGMATVHLAVSHGAEGFRRFFVVKRLREDVAQTPQVVHQFINEARLGASLVHSRIVPIFDFGRVGNEYFLAQEYILGRDLNLLVRRARQHGEAGLPSSAVFHLAREILDALAYAHLRADPSGRPLGIVHRDVSPTNVMVTRRGEVKLLDFGIAHFERRDGMTTDAGVVKGNLLFMSPEQARGLPIDARSDLFSLGLTLFFCFTGEPLYPQDGSDHDLIVRAAHGPGPLEEARISSLPDSAAELLRTALRIDPSERFQNADEFLLALPDAELFGGAAALLEAVERLVGAELASEEARFADLAAAPGDPPSSERTTDPGKTVVQFAVAPAEIHR